MKTRIHSTFVKQSHRLQLMSLSLLIIILISPVSTHASFALDSYDSSSAQGTVAASAVVVPAQVSQLGFLISALAKEVPVKEGDTVIAGQTLIVLDTPDLQFAVKEAEAALRSAQTYADRQKYRRVKNRRNGKIFYDVVPPEIRQLAEAKAGQAQVALELAQINLTEGTLTAPFDGIVASVNVTPGEFVQEDQAVLTLATLNDLQIETTDLSERDIAGVKIGAPVTISVGALNQTIQGRVKSISPISNTVGGDVIFKVTIAFDKQPENLLWGMTAEVNIEE